MIEIGVSFSSKCCRKTENLTTYPNNVLDNENNPSRFLNNLLNISKNEPELIEYYDLDEITTVPEMIYPDPDAMFNAKKEEGLKVPSLDFDRTPKSNGGNGDNGAIMSEIDWNRGEETQAIEPRSGGAFSGDTDDQAPGNGAYQNVFNLEDLKNDDLREHDIIDNIMYIYYGSSVALRKSLGGSIIIFGTVFALAAQILAVVFTLLRNR